MDNSSFSQKMATWRPNFVIHGFAKNDAIFSIYGKNRIIPWLFFLIFTVAFRGTGRFCWTIFLYSPTRGPIPFALRFQTKNWDYNYI